MKILSVVTVVFSLLGAVNIAMAEDDHEGVVTGTDSNGAANSTTDYDYHGRSNPLAKPADSYEERNGRGAATNGRGDRMKRDGTVDTHSPEAGTNNSGGSGSAGGGR